MEIFFHIGLQKTGTTFLQREVFPKVRESDFQYIDGHDYPFVFNKFRFQDVIYFDAEETKAEILGLAQGKRKLLISFEDLSGHPYNAAQSRSAIADKIVKCFPDAKIIFFLRRQDQFAVSSYLQTVKGGNSFSLKEYYSTIFLENHHDRFICPTRDYFLFEKYVSYLVCTFGLKNCFIRPYESFLKDNESIINELFAFLGSNEKFEPIAKQQNVQKGVIYTSLLRFENYFLARRITSNSIFFSGIPIYNFRKKKKSYLNIKNGITFLIKKGWFWDIKFKDKSGTTKAILSLCAEDNRKLDAKFELDLNQYGYY
jgi:hypothetical protein